MSDNSCNDDFRTAQLYIRAQELASDARAQVWNWIEIIAAAIDLDRHTDFSDSDVLDRMQGRNDLLGYLREELARMDRYESMCEVIRRAL